MLGALGKVNLALPVTAGLIATLFRSIKASATGEANTIIGTGLINNIKSQQKQTVQYTNDIQKASTKLKSKVTGDFNVLGSNLQSNNQRIQKTLKSSSRQFKVYKKDTDGVGDSLKQASVHTATVSKGFASTAKSMALGALKSSAMNVGVSLLNGALMSLVAGGITLAIKGIDDYIHKAEDAYEATSNSVQKTQSEISDLKSSRTTIQGLAEDFEKLSKKTNLSADEAQKLAEYKEQIAEIFPELVSGYDEEGNPILMLSEDTQELIDKLNEAIKQEQELLKVKQSTLARDAGKVVGDYETNNSVAGNVLYGLTKDDINPFWSKTLLSNGIRDLEDGCKQYIEKYEGFINEVEEKNRKLYEKNEEYQKYQADQRQDVLNELNSGDYEGYSSLATKQKQDMTELITLYDWSNELVRDNISKRNDFMEDFEKISDYSRDHYKDVEKWNEQLKNANQIYQDTGDLEQYQKAIRGIAEQLEVITGRDADEWITGFTQQLTGNLDAEQIKLANFLKGYNKTLFDLDIDKDEVAVKLKAQFQELQKFLLEISDEGVDVTSKINIITKIGKNEDGYKDLPPQIRQLIVGMTDGGDSVSETELQLITHVSNIVQTNGQLTGEQSEFLEKLVMGELTQREIETGITLADGNTIKGDILKTINEIQKDKDNNIKVDLDKDYIQEQLKDMKEQFKNYKLLSERESVQELFVNGTIDASNMSTVETFMEKFPIGEKQTVELVCELGGAFNDGRIEEYSDIIDYLLEHPEIPSKLNINVVGQETVNKVKTTLDTFMTSDSDKEIAVKINKAVADGDINGIREALEGLEEEKQVEIVTNITDALNELDTIDARVLKEKLIKTYIETDEVKEKVDEVEKKILNKKWEKSVVFKEQGYEATSHKLLELDNKGNPIVKEIDFTSSGYEKTVKEEDTTTKKAKDEEKKVTIKTEGYEITVEEEKDVTKNAKDEKKTVEIKTSGYGKTIEEEENVAKKAQDKDVTVSFFAKITSGLSNILATLSAGLSVPVKLSSGIGEFKNISNEPVEATTPSPISDVSMLSSGEPSIASTEGTEGEVSATALKPFGSLGASKSKNTTIKIDTKKILYALENSIKVFQELENRISRCNNQLDLLDKQMERSTGMERVEYLKKQNELYEEQARLQKEYYDSLVKEKLIVRKELRDTYGFKINEQGNLIRYDETMISMQKNYDSLEKAYEKAQKAESDYSGKSEKKKESLSKATEKAKEKLDKYQEKMDKVKTLTDEYLNLQYEGLPKAEQEWQDMKNAIEDNRDEIEQLLREDKLYKFKNSVTELTNEFKTLENTLDLVEAKMEYATGKEKIDLYSKQIKSLEEQRKNIQQTIDEYNQMVEVYKESLYAYGFEFDSKNNISNQEEILNKYQNTEELEKVTELMEEYIKLQTDDLPDAIVQWEELGNQIKDIQTEKLEVVQGIEDEITKIYEDEIEKRKKKIEEEKDATVKALEEQKEAYQDYRNEVDYKDEYNEQLDKINKLKSKISILERDNSLSSRSKLQELYDELEEEEKALRDIQQSKLDEEIEKMYDKEIEKAESDSEKKIEDLENLWTSQKISELVKEALLSNTFTDIDGNIRNLQDTLIDFAETSGEAIGIMGDSIKNDLVNNLQSALSILQQYSDIYSSLELKQYGTNYKDMYDSKATNKKLQVGDINIQIQGEVSKTTVNDMVKAIDEELKYISNRL